MVAPQQTRKVTQLLKSLKWEKIRTKGSHSTWKSPKGTTIIIPDGHKTISPGVYQQLLKAIEKDNQK